MQKLEMFTIFDRKSCSYGIPFFAPNRLVAVRMCQTAVNSSTGNSDVATYPEDFTLYSIGDFADGSGVVTPRNPEFCINLGELKVIPKVSGEGCRGESSPSARADIVNNTSTAPDENTLELPKPSVDVVLGAPAKPETV